MALTSIAQQTVVGPYAAEGGTRATTVTFTAGDATNGNKIVMSSGRTLLLVQNSDAAPGTFTIKSSKDPYGRSADITAQSVAASAFAAVILEPVGWEQTTGGRDLEISCSATTMKFLAIPL